MPAAPSAWLTAVIAVVLGGSLLPGASPAAHGTAQQSQAAHRAGEPVQAPVSAPTSLEALREQAEQVAKSLEQATAAWEKRQTKLDAAQRQLAGKLRQLRAADAELNKVRGPLAEFAGALYTAPGAGGLAPLTMSDPGQAMRTMTDVYYLAGNRNVVVEQANRLVQQRMQLAGQAEHLRATNLLEEVRSKNEMEALRTRSQQAVRDLVAALAKLGIRIDGIEGAALACNPTRAKAAAKFPNGLIPQRYLCALPQRGYYLRPDAAWAFYKLNMAYKRRFGRQMCVMSAYRSLSQQQSVYYRRPGMAAVPGRSNHGLGLALDFCGGVQHYGSVQFNWLRLNAGRYGWFHPNWANYSPFEPWHWEFNPQS